MSLDYWMHLLQEKRKQTPFQEYLKTLISWAPLAFYKNKGLISIYPPNTWRVQIIDRELFEKERHNITKYGKEYDFSLGFFENFQNLFISIPLPNLLHVWNNENCDYVDTAVNSKDSYLSFVVAWDCSNVQYSFMVRENSTDVLNSAYVIINNASVFQSLSVINSFQIFFSRYISNSNNIWFSSNLVWCSECIFCYDMENISYAIKNTVFEKTEYFRQKQIILQEKDKYQLYFDSVSKIGAIQASKNCTWSSILASDNLANAYFVNNLVVWNNIMFAWSLADGGNCYDIFMAGKWTKHCYWVVNFGGNPEHIYCSLGIGFSFYMFYCMFCDNCSFCFGCIGLINKQYCVFNIQYSKEQWNELVEKIFSSIEKAGLLGEYFPATMNPFYFNDTFAFLFGDFEKELMKQQWFLWRDDIMKTDIPIDVEIVSFSDLEKYEFLNIEGKYYIDPIILTKTIQDTSGNFFKVTRMEYDFLVKYELPLPREHYLTRLKSLF